MLQAEPRTPAVLPLLRLAARQRRPGCGAAAALRNAPQHRARCGAHVPFPPRRGSMAGGSAGLSRAGGYRAGGCWAALHAGPWRWDTGELAV